MVKVRQGVVRLCRRIGDSTEGGSDEGSMERNLPGVFRAAGLIVPEPSTMLPPMPFIEVEVGKDEVVEYMTTRVSELRGAAEAPG